MYDWYLKKLRICVVPGKIDEKCGCFERVDDGGEGEVDRGPQQEGVQKELVEQQAPEHTLNTDEVYGNQGVAVNKDQ